MLHGLAKPNRRLLDQRSKQANEVIDIDGVDMRNPQAVAQYACDIYNYYKEVEGVYHPQDYMGSQNDINEKMRAILMDWLIEVHIKFKVSHRPEPQTPQRVTAITGSERESKRASERAKERTNTI